MSKNYTKYNNFNRNDQGAVNRNRVNETQRDREKPEDVAIEKPEVKDEVRNNEVVENLLVNEPAVSEIKGVVTDCLKLNVRKNPNSASNVVCAIDCLTEVVIDEIESTEDFYKIYTVSGVEGFCMKKYIALKN